MNAGIVTVIFKGDSSDVDASFKSVSKRLNEFGSKDVSNAEKGFSKISSASTAMATIISNVTTKAINMVTDRVGDAIKRVDTLNNSTRVFEYMGFSADNTSRAMQALEASIKGLPTPLDEAVSGMQLIAAQNGDIEQAQRLYSALNNAVLGFGGTSAMASNAILQFSQDLGKGYISGSTFNSLLNANMGPALAAIASKFGTTSGALKEALGGLGNLADVGIPHTGDKVQWFSEQLMELNEKGGGGLESLQTIAGAATSGIGTGIQNMETAVTRGIGSIMEAFGQASISEAISNIGSAFETALKGIASFVEFAVANKDVFLPIIAAVGSFTAAIVALTLAKKAYKTVVDAIDFAKELAGFAKVTAELVKQGLVWVANTAKVVAYNAVLLVQKIATAAVTAAQWLYNVALNANPIGLIVLAIAALVAGFILLWNNCEGFRNFFISMWEGIKQVVGVVVDAIVWYFQTGWDILVAIWSAIIGFFQGLWDGIVAVFSFVVEFYRGVFQAAIDVIITIWNAITGFFQGLWDGIVNVFSSVGNWFKDVFQKAWDGIKSIWNSVAGFFQGIWDRITGIFGGIGNWFKGIFEGAVNGIRNVWDGLVGIIKTPINWVIDGLNLFIRGLNMIKIPDWVPGVGGKGLSLREIPHLAMGGIVTSPMAALIGESGAEAVMPLERNTGWLSELADAIFDRGEFEVGGRDVNIYQKNYLSNQVTVDQMSRGMARAIARS